MSTRIKVEMTPISTILTRIGVNKTGDVQMQVTKIVCNRITKYMPASQAEVMSSKETRIKSPTEIEITTDYAHYQYVGKKRVNAKTGKGPAFLEGIGFRYRPGTVTKLTDVDLQYDKTKHPQAGPLWDRRLMAAEKDAIVVDVQEYVRRKGK